jgi:hypothetical protein
MAKYTVTASVTVDVEMSIEAASGDAAKEIFDSQLMMTAALANTPKDSYVVVEDTISEVDRMNVDLE